jgi:hypothetical protein
LARVYSLEDQTSEKKEPHLFREALKYQWAHVVLRCATHPEEAGYVRDSDGATALLLALISRASSSKCQTASCDFDGNSVSNLWFNCDANPAPLDAIRALLKAWPSAVYGQCKKMGYTPLAYACLVPPRPQSDVVDDATALRAATISNITEDSLQLGRSNFRSRRDQDNLASWQGVIFDHIILREGHQPPIDMFDEAEALVGILLEGHRDSLSITSYSQLSPVDIHVISFSQARRTEEPSSNQLNTTGQIGKTTTSVLGALLESDPSLARPRLSSSATPPEATTAGPLEYLYRWNAATVLEAVERQRLANSMPPPSPRTPFSQAPWRASAARASSVRALSAMSARSGMASDAVS